MFTRAIDSQYTRTIDPEHLGRGAPSVTNLCGEAALREIWTDSSTDVIKEAKTRIAAATPDVGGGSTEEHIVFGDRLNLRAKQHMKFIAAAVQIHNHSATCVPSYTKDGEAVKCRLGFGQRPSSRQDVDPETGDVRTVVVRVEADRTGNGKTLSRNYAFFDDFRLTSDRDPDQPLTSQQAPNAILHIEAGRRSDCVHITDYCAPITLMVRGNTAMYITAGSTAAAHAASWYVVSYVKKTEKFQTVRALEALLTGAKKTSTAEDRDTELGAAASRLQMFANATANQHSYSMYVQVAALLGKAPTMSSAKFSFFDAEAIVAHGRKSTLKSAKSEEGITMDREAYQELAVRDDGLEIDRARSDRGSGSDDDGGGDKNDATDKEEWQVKVRQAAAELAQALWETATIRRKSPPSTATPPSSRQVTLK